MKKKPTSRVAQQQRATPILKQKNKVTAETKSEASDSFAIVGIGASAGGLEALEHFFGNVPEKCGFGFVVVQHLDPTHKNILVELLQRSTVMPVVQIVDRMEVKRDHVYVIPPDKDLSILHGVLHLMEPVTPRGLRLPIDIFFRSLADDRRHMSVGIILSGMGSDGALGLRDIKERAGGTFVQTPDSAHSSAPTAHCGRAKGEAAYLAAPRAHSNHAARRLRLLWRWRVSAWRCSPPTQQLEYAPHRPSLPAR